MAIDERRRMAHLLRRAGFGAGPAELEEWLALGFDGAVERLLHPESVEERAFTLEVDSPEGLLVRDTLQAVWLARMAQTKRPLAEKLALFWHGHFATSVRKVKSVVLMSDQVETFRRLGLGRFEELLLAVVQDPAMLVWLDNAKSKREAPNENLGRELLELFALGVGNYGEGDVKAAARALTGWSIAIVEGARVGDEDAMAPELTDAAAKRQKKQERRTRDAEFRVRPRWHDDGEKTFLGQTGNWDGADIVRIAAASPACAAFIARKLTALLLWDAPSADDAAPFAEVFTATEGDIRAVAGAILRSEAFSSERAYRARVKSPAEYVVGLMRELGVAEAPRGAVAAMDAMGQTLYAPPNVGGWTSGLGWVGPSTLLARYNLVNDLFGVAAEGRRTQPAALDAAALLDGLAAPEPAALIDALADRLLAGGIDEEQRAALLDYLARSPDGAPIPFDPADPRFLGKVRGLVRLLTTTPAYQLA